MYRTPVLKFRCIRIDPELINFCNVLIFPKIAIRFIPIFNYIVTSITASFGVFQLMLSSVKLLKYWMESKRASVLILEHHGILNKGILVITKVFALQT